MVLKKSVLLTILLFCVNFAQASQEIRTVPTLRDLASKAVISNIANGLYTEEKVKITLITDLYNDLIEKESAIDLEDRPTKLAQVVNSQIIDTRSRWILVRPAIGAIRYLGWSPDSRYVAYAYFRYHQESDRSPNLFVWDMVEKKKIKMAYPTPEDFYGVVWSEDGQQVITGTFDGAVKTWDIATGQLREEQRIQEASPLFTKIKILNGKFLIDAHTDRGTRLVHIYDLETGNILFNQQLNHQGKICTVVCHDKRFGVKFFDQTMESLNFNGISYDVCQNDRYAFIGARLSPNGKYVFRNFPRSGEIHIDELKQLSPELSLQQAVFINKVYAAYKQSEITKRRNGTTKSSALSVCCGEDTEIYNSLNANDKDFIEKFIQHEHCPQHMTFSEKLSSRGLFSPKEILCYAAIGYAGWKYFTKK